VSDEFAGKTGPCPNCKTSIQVPDKSQEVKVHAPDEFGGARGATGKLVLKPIARLESKFQPVVAAGVAAAVVVVAAITWIAGPVLQENLMIRVAGLVLITPPLVVAAYLFLHHDDELEPYRGIPLYVRSSICAAGYILLWGVFAHVTGNFAGGELWNWFVVAPPFLIMGSLVALATLDLDFGSGFLHYAFYVLVTIVLQWLAGMGWVWSAAGQPTVG
jgi:hypothetical protein